MNYHVVCNNVPTNVIIHFSWLPIHASHMYCIIALFFTIDARAAYSLILKRIWQLSKHPYPYKTCVRTMLPVHPVSYTGNHFLDVYLLTLWPNPDKHSFSFRFNWLVRSCLLKFRYSLLSMIERLLHHKCT